MDEIHALIAGFYSADLAGAVRQAQPQQAKLTHDQQSIEAAR